MIYLYIPVHVFSSHITYKVILFELKMEVIKLLMGGGVFVCEKIFLVHVFIASRN